MRSHTTIVATLALVATALSGLPTAVAAPAARAGAASPAVASVHGLARARHRITPAPDPAFVVTGQRLSRVRGHVVVHHQRTDDAMSTTFLLRGHRFYVPAAAVPYFHRVLDPSLFDATALLAHRRSRLPVVISHSGPLAGLTGVTLTGDRAGVATGFLTAASARRFGAALAARPDSVLANITAMSLPQPYAASGRSRVSSTFPMRTIAVRATDASGAPLEFGVGVVMNTADHTTYADFLVIDGGKARLSVPVGTYSAFMAQVEEPVTEGDPRIARLAVIDFTVTSATTVQRYDIDLAQASVPLTLETPRPLGELVSKANYGRTDAAGHGQSGLILGAGTHDRVLLPALAAPAVGSIVYAATFSGFEQPFDSTAGSSYVYDLFYPDDHIDADQAYTAVAADLATITADYRADRADLTGDFVRMPVDQSVPLGEFWPFRQPVVRTEYVGAPSGTEFLVASQADIAADDPNDVRPTGTVLYDAAQAYEETWRAGPVAPGFPTIDRPDSSSFCSACRVPTGIGIGLTPVTDSTPTHAGGMYGNADGSPAAHTTLTRNGKTLYEADDATGVAGEIPAASGRYRLTVDAERYTSRTTRSTRSHTVVAFTSRAGAGLLAPAAWNCAGCRVLPVLQATLSYPASGDGQVTPGTVPFEVTASRIQGAAPATPTTVSLWLRPSGWGWAEFPITADSEGRYRIDVDLPEWIAGTDVDIRVVAHDSGGSTWDQTVERAFRLAGTPSTKAAGRTRAGAFRRVGMRVACPDRPSGYRCLARWRPGAGASRLAPRSKGVGKPREGYGPRDIASMYDLDPRAPGMTVAIVDAYDYPQAEADLAAYRSAWGLPPCTTVNGCFRKIDQRGGTDYPEPDPGWALEMALDVQAVSAACPRCKILLVEADSAQNADMGAAVNQAVAEGALIVSNSYGSDEASDSRADDRAYYTHPGVAQLVSSGDSGFRAASYPAASKHVIAVGGTSVTKTAKGWRHRAWSGAGSACSAYFSKPKWQHDENCLMRTVSDVSALADPATGLAVYDTFGLGPDNGWIVVGGTSLASPLLAGMFAQAGHPQVHDNARHLARRSERLHDVVGGSNGFCGGDYLCTGLPGYDAPTGWGTPVGLGGL